MNRRKFDAQAAALQEAAMVSIQRRGRRAASHGRKCCCSAAPDTEGGNAIAADRVVASGPGDATSAGEAERENAEVQAKTRD